ncbi:MAG: hypothetical protein LC721_00435, partial [Actinobacteria bacterium]|nr:hypothetical protein [Actinomycetota bacterium]
IGQAAQVLVGIFQTLQPLLAGIGVLFDNLKPALAALGAALTPVIQALSTQLGSTFAQLGQDIALLISSGIGPLAAALGTVLVGVIQQLTPILSALVTGLTALAPGLTSVVQVLGTFLVGALQTVGPLFSQLLVTIGQLVGTYLVAITPVLQVLATAVLQLAAPLVQVGQAFLSIVQALIPILPSIAQLNAAVLQLVLAFLPLVTQLLIPFTQQLAQMAPVIAQAVPYIIQLAQFLTGVATALLPVVAGFVGFLVKVIQVAQGVTAAVAGLVARVVGFFLSLAGRVIGVAASIDSGVRGAIGRMIAGVIGFFASLAVSVSGAIGSFVATIQRGVARAVQIFGSIKSAVTGAISGLAGSLRQAGADAIGGFINGLEGALGRVRDIAGKIAGAVTGPVAKLLNMHSPSRVMQAMGNNTVQGYINGVRERLPALRAALTQLAGAVPSQVKAGIGKVASALNSLGFALTSGQRTKLNQFIASAQTGMNALERTSTTVTNKLKAANARLSDLLKQSQQFATQVATSILQTGSVTQGQDTSFAGIVKNLSTAVTNARQFQSVLASLSKAGLNKTALQQIAEAGPDQGTAVGKSILAAGAAGIATVNKLQAQLQTAANKAANTAAAALFGQGIKVAQGVVAGLQAQKTKLDAAMTRLGDILVARVLRLLRTTKVNSVGTLTIPGFKDGGLISRPTIAAFAEDGPEVAIPLTKPKRRDQLLDQYFGGWADQRAWQGGAGYGGSSKRVELHVPIQAGTVIDPQGLAGLVADEFQRRFGTTIGIDTAGGRI